MLDAYGINEGDEGWCRSHPAATVETIFAIDAPLVRDEVDEPGQSDECRDERGPSAPI